jgi:hypothetical protein
MNKKGFTFCILTALLTVIACKSYSTPEAALEAFYKWEAPEETLMDPLIVAGDKVVPLVIEKISDKKMPKRLYAIGFLGNGSYKQAIPSLEKILEDHDELEDCRAEALVAIFRIEASLGRDKAKIYSNGDSYLSSRARDILDGKVSLDVRRTYWEAAISEDFSEEARGKK